MAKTQSKAATPKVSISVGEKFDKISCFGNYEGLGEENFKALERGETASVEALTPELEALIKGKKIISK